MGTSDFTLAAVRISTRYDQLLSMAHVERMLAAPNADEAMRILHDMDWASSLAESDNPEVFERVIEAGLLDLKHFLVANLPNKALLEYLLLPFDLQNAKASLFLFRIGEKYENIHTRLTPMGFFPRRLAFSVLENPDKTRDKDMQFFANALLQAHAALEKNPESPEIAEEILDDAILTHMRMALDKINSGTLKAFFQLQLQAELIKQEIRRDNPDAGARVVEATPFLLQIPTFHLYTDIKSAVKGTFLESLFTEGKALEGNAAALSDWELRLDLAILDRLYWPARTNPCGPESTVVYFFTKLRNAEIIRTILIGKKNQLTSSAIREIITPYLPYLRKA